MIRIAHILAIFSVGVCVAGAQQPPAPPEPDAPRATEVSGFEVVPEIGAEEAKGNPGEGGSSRSSSRQFVVFADELSVRGAFCTFSEEVKKDLLTLLKQPDRWRYPVVISVTGHTTAHNRGAPVRSSIALVEGGGYKLQAKVVLGNAFSREAMRKELVTLLLAEQILRAHPNADFGGRRVLPDWLRIGVSEAIEFRRRGRPTELFSAIYKSGNMLSVNEIVHSNPAGMDSVSESIYRASCCGLVLALVNKENGPRRTYAMISDLAAFRGPWTALLDKHFPGTGESKNSLEKWWALELAVMAQPTVKDILDPVASEEALGRCLQVRFVERVELAADPDQDQARGGRRKVWQVFRPRKREDAEAEGGAGAHRFRNDLQVVDLSEYRRFIDRDDRAQLLSSVEVALLQLSYRAFPIHRAIIREYQRIIDDLRAGKTKRMDERFASLAAQRVELVRAARDATDYLHHYQATKVGRVSGAFEEYKKAVDELNKPRPPRRDSLSMYLDDLDKEYR